MQIIKDSIILALPRIFMQLINWITNELVPNKESLTLEEIQNLVESYISDQNKTNVKNREMIYTYDQMFQMFQSLSEDSKQKVGELIVSLSGKT